ncbi:hypothetical protein [Luteimonas sp. R10]|uniref:hypothetical protein n=1 Tax=Luteimonas sp. R10 TaxID=3108176 RepID=UPI0030854AD7|nr:hypothetical protein U3649_02250 [Luteimonas sp. R10]
MNLLQPVLLFLAAIPSVARADGPLINTWVELRVTSCMPATFEAPPYETFLYVKGDSHRTALITGRVVDSGLRDYEQLREYDLSEAQIRAEAERNTARLPRRNSALSVVLRQWDAEFCRRALDKVVRFDFNHSCDVMPFTGKCLPPVPLVDPSAR